MTDVRVGQTWEDADKRASGRRVRIVELIHWRGPGHPDDGKGVLYAVVELVSERGRPWNGLQPGEPARAEPGRRTRIRLDRFKPTATGYRLVENAPKENK